MRKVRYSEQANDDLRAIVRYLAEATSDRRIALTFAKRLRRRCDRLASFTQIMGSPRPDLAAGLRCSSEGNYLIFFRYVDSTFEVVRIAEGHQDLTAMFTEDDKPQE